MEEKYEMPIVTEWCSNCETEIEMRWDVDKRGYKAYCPVCGKELMLCDECRHDPVDGSCDWNKYDDCTCRRTRKPTRKEYRVFVTKKSCGETKASADTPEEAELFVRNHLWAIRMTWHGEEYEIKAEE